MRSIARADRPGVDRWAGRSWSALLALLVTWPLLGPGYTLSYDMVFVPDPASGARSLGLDGSVPRAVPMDFLLGLVGHVLPMPVVQQLALVFCVGGAALGMWRISPARTIPGAAAAASVYAWSAYTAERLVMGHWSLLLGVALLPWLVRACLHASRTPRRLPWAVVVLAGVVAAAAPTAGVLGGILVLALVWCLPLAMATRWVVTGSVALFNAVWVLPGLNAATVLDRTTAGVDAFALSSDTPLGPLVAALTGGGAWNHLVHPASRTDTPVSAAISLALVAIAAVGLVVLVRGGDRRPVLALGVLGVLGLLLAAGSATSAGQDLVGTLVAEVPGAGLLRDAQKWLAWWLLLVGFGLGPGIERLLRAFPAGQAAFVTACVALLPLVALPDLAGGAHGRLARSSWPEEYAAVATLLEDRPDDGAVLVLPWHAFRAWPWAGDRTVLDPWTRLVSRPVVVRDDLELAGSTVPGEDPTAADVGRLIDAGGLGPSELRALGIRYVLTDLQTAGGPAPTVPGEVLHDGPALELVDLGSVASDPADVDRITLVVDVTAGAWWLVAVVGAFHARRFRLIP